mmetsp:Transcript_14447/g.31829  ORF Transcript_14447/g.31829 Transcript_14447/m.31829 type:complete len:272 (+) Transcript_14447:1093-1908(+)
MQVIVVERRARGQVHHLLHLGRVRSLPRAHRVHNVVLHVCQQSLETRALQHQALHRPSCDDVCLAGFVGNQRPFSEKLHGGKADELLLDPALGARAPYLSLVDDIEAGPLLALADDVGTVCEGLHAHNAGEGYELVLGQLREQWNALQDADAHALGQHLLHRAQQHVELNPLQRERLHPAHGDAVGVSGVVQHQSHLSKVVARLEGEQIHFSARGLDLRALNGPLLDHKEALAHLPLSDDVLPILVRRHLQSPSKLADLLVRQRVQKGTLL